MKKIILFLGLFLISFINEAQQEKIYNLKNKANHVYNYEKERSFFIPNPDTLVLINVTPKITNNGWALYGTSCVGCPSFFYKILRTNNTIEAEDGNKYFYFYFYFYSNSFLANRELAGTYLTNINFYIDYKFVFNIPYILIEPENVVYAAWVRSLNPNSNPSFEVSKLSVH